MMSKASGQSHQAAFKLWSVSLTLVMVVLHASCSNQEAGQVAPPVEPTRTLTLASTTFEKEQFEEFNAAVVESLATRDFELFSSLCDERVSVQALMVLKHFYGDNMGPLEEDMIQRMYFGYLDDDVDTSAWDEPAYNAILTRFIWNRGEIDLYGDQTVEEERAKMDNRAKLVFLSLCEMFESSENYSPDRRAIIASPEFRAATDIPGHEKPFLYGRMNSSGGWRVIYTVRDGVWKIEGISFPI